MQLLVAMLYEPICLYSITDYLLLSYHGDVAVLNFYCHFLDQRDYTVFPMGYF